MWCLFKNPLVGIEYYLKVSWALEQRQLGFPNTVYWLIC
jgi:hypothetical protein